MRIEPKIITYFILILLIAWIGFLSANTLVPFVLAGFFAYLLNPVVSLLNARIRLPRILSISLIYLFLVSVLAGVILTFGPRLMEESMDFSAEARNFSNVANEQITNLPTWLSPIAQDAADSIRTSLLFPRQRIVSYLPGAFNRTVSILVFLVATFYFLKDGQKITGDLFKMVPKKYFEEIQQIFSKINSVLGNYLRAQFLLVVIMTTTTFIGLTVIGVRYSLILSVFTGFAEIIPYVGPVTAGAVASSVAFADGVSRFNGGPVVDVFSVVVLYLVLRQIEDLFIAPQIMGRLTKLHPLVVMFSVLAGGHIFGVIGFLAAVPVVASLKVLMEHILSLVEKEEKRTKG